MLFMNLFGKQVRLFSRSTIIAQHCKTQDLKNLVLFRNIQHPEQLDSLALENIYQDLQHKENEFNGRTVELLLDLYFKKIAEFGEYDWNKKWQNQMVDKIVSVKKYNHNNHMIGGWGMDLEILMKIGLWADLFCVRDPRLWEFIQTWLQKVVRILDDTNTQYFLILLESISHQQQADQQLQDYLVEFIEKNYEQIRDRGYGFRLLKCMYLLKMGRLEFIQKLVIDLEQQQIDSGQTKFIQIVVDELVDDQITLSLQKRWGQYHKDIDKQYVSDGVGQWMVSLYWKGSYDNYQEYREQLYGYLLNNVDNMKLKELLDVIDVLVDIKQKYGQYVVQDRIRHAIQGWVVDNRDRFKLADNRYRQQLYSKMDELGIMTSYLDYFVENKIVVNLD